MSILMYVNSVLYFIAAIFGFINIFAYRNYDKFWVSLLYVALAIVCILLGFHWEV